MGTSDYGAPTDYLSSPSLSAWAAAIVAQIAAGPLFGGSGIDVTSDLVPPPYVEGRFWLHPKAGSCAVVGKSSNSSTAAGTPTGSLTVQLPAGILTGQIAVLFVSYANATASAFACSGWGALGPAAGVQGANLTTAVLTKSLVSTDSSTTITVSCTNTSSTRMAATVIVCDAVTLPSAGQSTQATETTGTGGVHALPTVSAGGAGLLLAYAVERPGSLASWTSPWWTVPSPYVKTDDGYVTSSTSLDWVAASKVVSAAGTVGGEAFTSAGGTQANAHQRVVFLPAA